MKHIAFVFTHAPHGTSSGREGLDALLASSSFCQPGVFFISDGVLQLLPAQQPARILARDYIATFKILPLYDINDRWICTDSLQQRGLAADSHFIIPVTPLPAAALQAKLHQYDSIFTF